MKAIGQTFSIGMLAAALVAAAPCVHAQVQATTAIGPPGRATSGLSAAADPASAGGTDSGEDITSPENSAPSS